MEIDQLLQFVKEIGLPKSKVNAFVSVALRKPIESVINVNKIMQKLNVNQATIDRSTKLYIQKYASVPHISISNTTSNKKKNTESIHIISESSKKGNKSANEAVSVLLNLKKNTHPSMTKNAPTESKKKFVVSLKGLLNRNMSVVRNGNNDMIQVNLGQGLHKRFAVPRSLNASSLPNEVTKPLLSKFIANAHHPVVSKRRPVTSVSDLVNRASHDPKTARLLGNALNMRLPKTLLPHHKQKIKNATMQFLQNGTRPARSQPKQKSVPKNPMIRLKRERNALVDEYFRNPSSNLLNKVEAKAREMKLLMDGEREEHKKLQAEYLDLLQKSKRRVGDNFVYNETVLTSNELQRAKELKGLLKKMNKKMNKHWNILGEYNDALYHIDDYNGTVRKGIQNEIKRIFSNGRPVNGNYEPPPLKFRKVEPVRSATMSNAGSSSNNSKSRTLGSSSRSLSRSRSSSNNSKSRTLGSSSRTLSRSRTSSNSKSSKSSGRTLTFKSSSST
jgi:hypothetical protein